MSIKRSTRRITTRMIIRRVSTRRVSTRRMSTKRIVIKRMGIRKIITKRIVKRRSTRTIRRTTRANHRMMNYDCPNKKYAPISSTTLFFLSLIHLQPILYLQLHYLLLLLLRHLLQQLLRQFFESLVHSITRFGTGFLIETDILSFDEFLDVLL